VTLVIALDPGHGGDDPGAVWPTGSAPGRADLVEADVALELALGLQHAIESLDWPVAVVLTRDEPGERPDFATRAAIAAKADADLVLSIHVNASADHARGLMCFVRRGDAPGYEIAGDIMRAAPRPLLRSSMAPTDAIPDGWTSRAWTVLQRHERPSVLVEAGFATHPGDRACLLSPEGRDAIIAALLVGVARLRILKPV
jgi:N-acetylmuramoyl-L-alanine amidase